MSISSVSATSVTAPVAKSIRTAFKPAFGEGREARQAVVKEVFRRVIEPLYGSQEVPLKKMEEGRDRTTRLLYDGEEPVGLVCYKDKPNDEFRGFGVYNSIEIKTLCLVDPKKDSGKGFGSQLLKRVEEVAKEARAKFIHVTVSESVIDSLGFFKKNGFHVAHTFEGKYLPGVKEYLLFKKMMTPEEAQKHEKEVKESLERTALKRKQAEASSESEKRARVEVPASLGAAAAAAPAPRADDRRGDAVARSLRAAAPAPRESDRRYDRRDDDRRAPAPDTRTYYRAQRTFGGGGGCAGGGAPRMLEATLRDVYVNYIKSGQKTIEGRINAGMFYERNLTPGQHIRFFAGSNSVTCRLVKIAKYRSFPEMLARENYKTCIPECSSREAAEAVYARIPGYTERAARSGVLALHIERITT